MVCWLFQGLSHLHRGQQRVTAGLLSLLLMPHKLISSRKRAFSTSPSTCFLFSLRPEQLDTRFEGQPCCSLSSPWSKLAPCGFCVICKIMTTPNFCIS